MTENGLPEGTIINQPVNPESAPAPEKMLPQSHVNSVAKGSHDRGVQKGHQIGYQAGYQQALQELNQTHLNTGMQTQGQPQTGMAQQQPSGLPQATPDYVHRNQLAVEFDKFQQQQAANYHGQRIYNEMEAKKSTARQAIPDYDQVVNSIDFTKIPEVYMALNGADNAGHLLYEMANNPQRLAHLRSISDIPGAAAKYVKDFSDSVKQNAQAANTKFPPEPISQIKSNLTMADSGSRTAADRKKDPKYVW